MPKKLIESHSEEGTKVEGSRLILSIADQMTWRSYGNSIFNANPIVCGNHSSNKLCRWVCEYASNSSMQASDVDGKYGLVSEFLRISVFMFEVGAFNVGRYLRRSVV
jgi:hypothetical protein